MISRGHTTDYLSSILRAFKDLIFIFNAEGVILDYLQDENSELLYVPKQKFIGRSHKDVLPPWVSNEISKAISEIRNGKSNVTFDYDLNINGKIAWFTAVFSEFRQDDDVAPEYLCVIREITERKEKELLLQRVLENAFNAFIVFQSIRNSDKRISDFEIILVNHEAEKLLGKSAAKITHTLVSELTDQNWILFDEYVKVVETGEALDQEYSYEKDESTVWIHTHASKMEEGLVVTVKDITEKKKSELLLQSAVEELRLSRRQMDLFFSQALTGFFFMMLDEPLQWDETIDKDAALEDAFNNLHLTRVNNEVLKQYGATYEEFIKRRPRDFFKSNPKEGYELLRQLFDQGRIHINRASQKIDGSELWLEGNYITFTDSEDRILGYFGIQQDVTQNRHAEESLRQSEERYRVLANNMMELVALHEPDGKYKYVSPSVIKLLGYSPQELIGKNPYELFHPDDIQRIKEESHIKAKEGLDVSNFEFRIRKQDGQYIWFSTNTKPIKDADGKVLMLQTVSRDVTEKINTLHVLEELNHQKNKLFSIIAHDLRGPLASCMGLLYLTQSDVAPDDLKKYLRMARQSAMNLHELMEDLLLWAGSQLNKISFDPDLLDVKNEIEVVVRRFEEIAQTKEISVSVNVEEKAAEVYADKDMLRTIIRNLLSNAIKFTKPGGKVSINARLHNNLVEISVTDNGTGIKEEDIEKLFSNVSTFTTYGTKGEKGTGLGLDICKDFVERHGGEIRVESKFGEGSKFVFTLKDLLEW